MTGGDVLKSLTSRADDGHMEPLDRRPRGEMLPPPAGPTAPAVPITTRMAVTPGDLSAPPVSPAAPSPAATSSPGAPRGAPAGALRPMAPVRILGAALLLSTLVLMGWQVRRLADDEPWSSALMWMSVLTATAVALCVLAWTWIATDNARQLVQPAIRSQVPDPRAAVRTWILPFGLVGVAVGVVTVLGVRSGNTPDGDAVPIVPLAVAVVALLLSIPATYRPLHHLAGVVRQVGGYSVRLSQLMWVPVVMALLGVASLVALRVAGLGDGGPSAAAGSSDAAGWAPLWVIGVVAVAPCLLVVLIAWRAASSVEDAISMAFHRRGAGASGAAPVSTRRAAATPRSIPSERAHRIVLVPGDGMLRLVLVTLVAGLALLSLVGAAVTGQLWLDSRDAGVSPAERASVWDSLDALRAAASGVTVAMVAAASAWTFVAVWNVRRVSGRRRNPLAAAVAWPAAAVAVWWIADGFVVDEPFGRAAAGVAAQAAVLAVPFLVLERSAAAVDARRTPLRIVYALVVVLLVHVQGLGGLWQLPDAATATDVGRLAGYLAIGALIQLCSTLAVTEACQAVSRACRHEAEHHNMLLDQHAASSPGSDRARPEAVVGR